VLLADQSLSSRSLEMLNGGLGGLQIGYNWQSGHGSMASKPTAKWFATFRGRVGFSPADRALLIFATGGLAVGE
jgi:hypothetical protein